MREESKLKKILITGGHLTPALALVDFLQSRGVNKLYWAGTKHSQTFSSTKSPEYNEVKKRNIKFYSIHAGKIWRKWTRQSFLKAIYNTILVPFGFLQSFVILLTLRPALVISFGGYIALPIVIAAKMLRIKIITHEQTIVAGTSNKIISKLADKIMLSWKSSLKHYPKDKTILTGNPIRKEILEVTTNKYNLDKDLPVIYITGGNQGSNHINWRIYKILPDILKIANIIHQTGHSTVTNDYEQAKELFLSLPDELKKRYIFFDNVFGPEIGEIYAKADLIVSRAGANTMSEILALDKYALFMPIPWSSHNEQQLNAEYAMREGCGEIIKQREDLTPEEFKVAIISALKNAKKKEAAGIKSTASLDETSVEKIYKVIEEVI